MSKSIPLSLALLLSLCGFLMFVSLFDAINSDLFRFMAFIFGAVSIVIFYLLNELMKDGKK